MKLIKKINNSQYFPLKFQEFLCTECGKSFNRSSNLRQHILRHAGDKKFPCHLCPAKFVSKGNLKAHMSTHTAKKPFNCNICGSSFTQSYSLVKHHRIHSGERPYQCEFCDQKFYSSDHLKRHIRTHTGEKVRIKLTKINFHFILSLLTALQMRVLLEIFRPKRRSQQTHAIACRRKHLRVFRTRLQRGLSSSIRAAKSHESSLLQRRNFGRN